jgi:Ca-activated chloride channel homolog
MRFSPCFSLVSGGNNRVILATDGDFNVGVSSEGELVRLIEHEREDGIYLTVLGVGEGNLADARMEALADHGNGNYAYLDGLAEARKVLVEKVRGTLFTVAKDVKVQVEFNPTGWLHTACSATRTVCCMTRTSTTIVETPVGWVPGTR